MEAEAEANSQYPRKQKRKRKWSASTLLPVTPKLAVTLVLKLVHSVVGEVAITQLCQLPSQTAQQSLHALSCLCHMLRSSLSDPWGAPVSAGTAEPLSVSEFAKPPALPTEEFTLFLSLSEAPLVIRGPAMTTGTCVDLGSSCVSTPCGLATSLGTSPSTLKGSHCSHIDSSYQ